KFFKNICSSLGINKNQEPENLKNGNIQNFPGRYFIAFLGTVFWNNIYWLYPRKNKSFKAN
ncbi:hypothetical protein TNCT_297481, partial [Trichonephila clavata]